jgi:hypothetical protein
MNLTNNAVPVLRRARLALSVGVYGHNFDFVANKDKNLHSGVRAGRLVAVHFDEQASKVTLRSRIGPLRVFAESQELA